MPVTSSLIIATYNWPQALELCLQSVKKQTSKPDEIIIADDGSGDETKTIIENFKKSQIIPVKHIWHNDNGFRLSVIRNKAIAASTADYILQIDGDVLLHPDFVKDHLSAVHPQRFIGGSRVMVDRYLTEKIFLGKKNPSSYLFNKHILNRFNSIRIPFLSSFISKTFSPSNIENIRGCNISFWKKDFIAVNGYNEEYTGWGREDSDLIVRFFRFSLKRTFFKFKGIAYHLYHKENDRSSIEKNDELLKRVMQKQDFRCEKGIDQYL